MEVISPKNTNEIHVYQKGVYMQILILGGTGFIGKYLASELIAKGHTVLISGRRQAQETDTEAQNVPHVVQWDGENFEQLCEIAKDAEVIINLVGENIAASRWTKARKEQILQSRINACSALCQFLSTASKLKVVLQASATGYYGYWDEESKSPVCVESSPNGPDFLAEVCQKWEEALSSCQNHNVRLCFMRFAPVLGYGGQGGFLAKLLPPFQMYAGGIPGSGLQAFSWIHIHDLCLALTFLMENEKCQGAFNFSAPAPCTMEEFIVTLANTIDRPYSIPMPATMLKLMFGEMAESTMIGGQRAIPQALLDQGFLFEYPNIKIALENIFE